MKYVLITPSRNEEKFIQKTLDSMVAQTLLPVRWVIVDDGSTDRTGQLADDYAARYPWIEVVHRPQHLDRSFAGKVHAFNDGFERVKSLEFEVVGNLDSDLSFDADYLKFLMQKFEENPKLGVAGTPFIENGYDSARDSFEGQNHVAGGCQLFRRKCWEDIGGYVPNRAGGIDWVAVTTARMKGWTTQSFLEKRFNHYRSLGTAERGVLAALFSYGEKDYYLGNSPIWEIFRIVYRMLKQPVLFGGLAVGAGYFSAAIRRMKRAVSPELMRFHRREQMKKLKAILGSAFRLKKVDNFRLETKQS
ncbi:MAG TPA: glycosyltransferase family 2 protein [Verrucomicrobiae bacterium]|jgi:glycosyltransferase involved in cell wall biosynthesis|nr:glycosyltransferase family 2 protein [Verrucomicrobiae bacterium]